MKFKVFIHNTWKTWLRLHMEYHIPPAGANEVLFVAVRLCVSKFINQSYSCQSFLFSKVTLGELHTHLMFHLGDRTMLRLPDSPRSRVHLSRVPLFLLGLH